MNDTAQILDGHRISGGGSARVHIDGKPFLNFGGCNYLALTDRPELRAAARDALEKGYLFSRYLHPAYGGMDEPFDKVEAEAARFFGTESAIYLPSGYHIGFAALAALRPEFDALVLDQQAHWCLEHAAILSGLPLHRFDHCDAVSLERVLGGLPPGQRPLIATDGAFATSGRLPPLDEYVELAKQFNGQVVVDESHATGVVGATGRGAAQHFKLGERIHVGSTLSKGLCAQGATFAGNAEMIKRARQTQAIRGSSPGSPISAEVATAAMKLVREHPELCARVRQNARYLRSRLQALGLDITETPAAIVSFTRGSFADLRALQSKLFDAGMYVLHSNYIAAGPSGTIRMTVFADHSQEDLDLAILHIGSWTAARANEQRLTRSA
ncbi:MAG: aminotransferase class I/II-fold pyridoxal phosphate-dependent enzyme [Xanthomonadales bacterium]|nr:aminotransferase class I/II-fold pyridoxal phosphate-dependent enzyme [Xanthomonadales bacterium]